MSHDFVRAEEKNIPVEHKISYGLNSLFCFVQIWVIALAVWYLIRNLSVPATVFQIVVFHYLSLAGFCRLFGTSIL